MCVNPAACSNADKGPHATERPTLNSSPRRFVFGKALAPNPCECSTVNLTRERLQCPVHAHLSIYGRSPCFLAHGSVEIATLRAHLHKLVVVWGTWLDAHAVPLVCLLQGLCVRMGDPVHSTNVHEHPARQWWGAEEVTDQVHVLAVLNPHVPNANTNVTRIVARYKVGATKSFLVQQELHLTWL